MARLSDRMVASLEGTHLVQRDRDYRLAYETIRRAEEGDGRDPVELLLEAFQRVCAARLTRASGP